MIKKKSFYAGLLAACLLSVPSASSAHSVWVEPGPDGALVVRFGELDGDIEKSPGYLDSLETPVAAVLPAKEDAKPLESVKKTDHFTLGGVTPDQPLVAETAFPVMAFEGKPARRPFFYSRWLPAGGEKVAGQPSLTLDIVPTGTPGEARVYFRGKPLAGAKAKLNDPAGKETDLKTDEQGVMKFSSTEPGRWVLTVPGHSEELSGFAVGRAYNIVSHNASLTWVVAKS